MVDRLTSMQRSRLMGRVRHHGTSLELILRKALWAAGLRYRLRTKERLPGSPDIVFLGAKVAVFVDGCFWHGCPAHGTHPKTNVEFWMAKITRNRERDAQVDAKLAGMGWVSIRLWEHDVRNHLEDCLRTIAGSMKFEVKKEKIINRS